MFSKERTGLGRQVTKTTLKAQSIVSLLLQQFSSLRPKVAKLFGEAPSHQKSLMEILNICKKIPKSLERSIHINHELQICGQLSEMIDSFTKSKMKSVKPYAVFLLWKNFQQKLIQRVQMGFKGKIDTQNPDSDNFKLMSFIQELENITNSFENWANNKTKEVRPTQTPINRISQQKNVELVFPKTPQKNLPQGLQPSNRETATSTAMISGKMSKHQKRTTCNDVNSFSRGPSEHLVFRASTAKLQRKELRMAVRCPSAAQLLKEQSFKQSAFEVKRPTRQSKQKSMELISQECLKIPTVDSSLFDNKRLSKFWKKNSFLLPRGSKVEDEDNLNVSILQKQFDSESNQKDPLSFDLLQINGGRGKKKKATVRDSIFKNLSQPSKQLDGNLDPHRVVRKSERKRTLFSSRMLSRAQIQEPQQKMKEEEEEEGEEEKTPEDSLFDFDDQDFKIPKSKKKVTYKKVRRSGKYLAQEKETWVDLSRFATTKKSVKQLQSSRRRKAILPLNNGSFGDLKSNMAAEEQLNQQKRFQFQQNVFLAVTDVLKSSKQIKTNRQEPKQKARPNSLTNILAQLNNFVQENPFEGQKNFGSVFFRQQQKYRESEDEALKERIRKLAKLKSQCSNIFQMGYRCVSNKDVIYNQIHRNECFHSDQEWIKHAVGLNEQLLQKHL